jgi:anti-anti-sigma regulatory factor
MARQPFSVSIAPDGAFVPVGELDLLSLKELRDMVNDVMIPGRPIVLDLAQLTFIEGGVIHWLVEVCDATGQPVIIRNASPSVRRVLDIVSTVDADGDAWVFAADAN